MLEDIASRFPHATTEDVCQLYIVPKTLEGRCSFLDLLLAADPVDHPSLPRHLGAQPSVDATLGKASPPSQNGASLVSPSSVVGPVVGPATVFVSHAWKCVFSEVVEALVGFNKQQQARGRGRQRFWFDTVCNNQHGTQQRGFDWWCRVFRESTRSIGTVVFVMTPWDDPVPLQRAWCLFEMFSSIVVQADMHVVIPAAQHDAFEQAVGSNFVAIMDVLVRLDVQRVTASNMEDQHQILGRHASLSPVSRWFKIDSR